MTGCKNSKLIGPYLDGQLGDCRWLDEHIGECSECLAEYEMVLRINHLSLRSDFSPPESYYWKNFATRVMARIAARPTLSFVARLKTGFAERKLALGVLTSLAIIALTVMAVNVFYPLVGSSGNSDIGQPRAPDIITAVQTDLAQSPDEDDAGQSSGTADADAIAESKAPQVLPAVSKGKVEKFTGDRSLTVQPAAEEIEITAEDSRRLQETAGLKLRSLTSGEFRDIGSRSPDLIGVDLNAVADFVNHRPLSFSSDQVIRYRILVGSNSSMVPISSHREAAGRFFAPEKTGVRDAFKVAPSLNWGYAGGNIKHDSEKLRRLRLELDLSREK